MKVQQALANLIVKNLIQIIPMNAGTSDILMHFIYTAKITDLLTVDH